MTDGLFGDKLEVYYFGAYETLGHYLYNNKGKIVALTNGPSERVLDGQLLSKKYTTQGNATCAYMYGWTVISFWDRTGDPRHGSNSAFLVNKIIPFEQLLVEAKKQYPKLFKRFTFTVTLA